MQAAVLTWGGGRVEGGRVEGGRVEGVCGTSHISRVACPHCLVGEEQRLGG